MTLETMACTFFPQQHRIMTTKRSVLQLAARLVLLVVMTTIIVRTSSVEGRRYVAKTTTSTRTPFLDTTRPIVLSQQQSAVVSSIPRGGGRLIKNFSKKKPVKEEVATVPAPSNKGLQHTIKVGFYFTLWYGLNVWYNIINKRLLNKIPSSLIIGTIQLGVGATYAVLLWLLRLRSKPIIASTKPYWIVGSTHAAGQLCSMVSLMAGPVSFTHIVKALEPFFSAGASIAVSGTILPWPVYITLLPVVGGVAYACFNESSFSWLAFWAAMASNVAFAFRAVLSKFVMTGNATGTANLTPVNIFALITIASFVQSIPIALVAEGKQFLSLWNTATQQTPTKTLLQAIVVSGLVHYLNNEVMYLALSNVHPITLAVGNTMKRVVIIVASVLAFGTDVTIQAGIGSAIGIIGVLLYSVTRQYYENLEIQFKKKQALDEAVAAKGGKGKKSIKPAPAKKVIASSTKSSKPQPRTRK